MQRRGIYIMNKISFRKYGRFVAAAIRFVIGLAYFAAGWFIISHILINTCSHEVHHWWTSWGANVYVYIAVLLVLRNTYHRFKWYISHTPAHVGCPKCHTVIALTRYGEERWLDAPVTLYVNFGTFRYRLTQSLLPIYMIMYRPYLQLDCPECGEKQVICPYCHEPIPQESVITLYDKPSKCPHCGKKIYTPVPLQEWEKELIKVKNLSD